MDDIATNIGVKRPTWKYVYFDDLLEEVKTYQREGFVVYDQESDIVLKIKTPFYLTSKFIARTKQLDKIFNKNYKQVFVEVIPFNDLYHPALNKVSLVYIKPLTEIEETY